ncbi:MAG TPA: hypothetical protein VN380_12445 [Thermoanaerobaculia bacterium]|nr:hypothetical protein [Thermoanaerobaculia bacterium]
MATTRRWTGADLKEAATTRQGFFVLIVVVAEGLLTILASRAPSATDRTLMISGMLVLMLIAVFTVAVRGGSLTGQRLLRLDLIVVLPRDIGVTNHDVVWSDKDCFLHYGDGAKVPIVLVRSTVSGESFHVALPEKFLRVADGDTYCELHLADERGVTWKVPRFYIFKIQQPLLASKKELQKAYGDDE